MDNLEFLFTTKGADEILCVISKDNNILTDWQTFVKEYPDSTITDRFYIVYHINTKIDDEGNVYNWYIVDNHYREIDKTPRLEKANEEMKKIQDDNDAMLVDQEYRLTMMELGV